MDEAVEPRARFRIAEDAGRDPAAVERAVRAVDPRAVLRDQPFAHGGIAVRDLVPHAVGLDHARAVVLERARHRGLAAARAPDQPEDEEPVAGRRPAFNGHRTTSGRGRR